MRTGVAIIVLALAVSAPCASAPPQRVREPALAGTWYPASRAELVATAHGLMRAAAGAPVLPGRPVALVVPHAGWSYSGVAAGAAYRNLHPGDFDRVVVVAPSHHGAFDGFALDDATAYRTPLGEVPLCPGVRADLERGGKARVVAGVAGPEHAVEIELPFLQLALGRFCLVPVLAGRAGADDQRAFAERLATLEDGRTLFVFSSDFTHYGPRFDYTPFGPSALGVGEKIRAQDARALALLSALDADGFRSFLRETGATVCGQVGLATMAELLARLGPKPRPVPLAQYASAELPGGRDANSVDYLALAFVREAPPSTPPLTAPPQPAAAPADAPPLGDDLGVRLPRLARAALETELLGSDALQRALAAFPVSAEADRLQAVFVTLNRTDPAELRSAGRLRGCIGQVEAVFPMSFAVVRAALDAALHDPRFPPVTAAELPRLEAEVTLLSPPRPVPSWKAIVIGTHGIVIEKGGRRALFLPQVPVEQGWGLEQTLSALSSKAGLPGDGWREGARFSVFTGQVLPEHGRRP